MGELDVAPAGLRSAETQREGAGATLHCQVDRIEPGPDGALDPMPPGRQPSEAASLSAASIAERTATVAWPINLPGPSR